MRTTPEPACRWLRSQSSIARRRNCTRGWCLQVASRPADTRSLTGGTAARYSAGSMAGVSPAISAIGCSASHERRAHRFQPSRPRAGGLACHARPEGRPRSGRQWRELRQPWRRSILVRREDSGTLRSTRAEDDQMRETRRPNKGAAVSRRPAGQWDGARESVSDYCNRRASPAGVAELGHSAA